MQSVSQDIIEIDTGGKKPYQLEIKTQDVTLRGLPESLLGATFVHISDLHGGFGHNEAVYEKVISHVNSIDPDYIFFTGDYIDSRSSVKSYPMAELLRQFQARKGIYGVLGNHDHRIGMVGSKRLLEASGIQLIYNENFQLENGLWLAGVDDLYEGVPDVQKTFRGLPEEVTTIVLSHNPRLIEKANNRDLLILSGHTHGGQFVLPFPTPLMICYLHLRCWEVAGWYTIGRTRLYVNRGIGVTGKPYRINCPAELGIFRMQSDPAEMNKNYLKQGSEVTAVR